MLPQALSMLPHLPTSWVSLNAFLHDELAAWLRVRLGRRPVGRKGAGATLDIPGGGEVYQHTAGLAEQIDASWNHKARGAFHAEMCAVFPAWLTSRQAGRTV